jgi:hypothetical protein
MVSLSVHLSVSILSSTFYDFIFFKYVYFSYIVAVSFIGGGNRRTRRNLSTLNLNILPFLQNMYPIVVKITGTYSIVLLSINKLYIS